GFGPHQGERQMNSGTARREQSKADGAVAKVGAKCEVEAKQSGRTVLFEVAGELDMSCMKRFRDLLTRWTAQEPDDLVIDLRRVTFIDSTGLVLLLRADTVAREEGFHLHVVRSPAEIVRAVFEVSGVDTLLPLSDDPPRL